MTSDDEELAQLRRERAARMGSAGLTVTSLRNQLDRDAQRNSDNAEEERPTVVDAAELGPAAADDADDAEDDDSIPAELRAHFPTSFGAPSRSEPAPKPKPATEPADGPAVGPPPPPPAPASDSEPEIGPPAPPPDDSDAEEDPWSLPVSSEAVLEAHSRVVTALAVDPSGGRLVTGSHDYTVKLFDFNGMKSDCRAFRSIEPAEGHPVVALSWSPNGDAFLAITSSAQPKVYDRDGHEQAEMPRGDMYIRDLKNTRGHITSCTAGEWHPLDKATGATASEDGTVRVWDMWRGEQKVVIKPNQAKPGRVAVTACAWAPDGRTLAGGLADGALQIWDLRGKVGHSAAVGTVPAPRAQGIQKQNWSCLASAATVARGAHASDAEITCIRYSRDGKTLLTRGTDETLKLWDVRKLKTPVAAVAGLPTQYSTTQACFSPDEKLVVTGVSPPGRDGAGALAFFDAKDLSLVRRLGVPGAAVAVSWHPKINQIVVGCGDRKEGTARVLYDQSMSIKGALLAAGRRPRAAAAADFAVEIQPTIYNPNALPMYRDDIPGLGGGGGKRRAGGDAGGRSAKLMKPEKGEAAPGAVKGAQGKLGSTGGTLLTQYIMKHQGQLRNPADEDVRASILRHAGNEEEMAMYTSAYAETQPKPIFAEPDEEEEEEGGGGGGGGAR